MTFHVRKEGVTLNEISNLSPCQDGLQDFMMWLVDRGERLGCNDKIPKALIKAALKHEKTWLKWAKEEKIVETAHEKVNVGHVYSGKKLHQSKTGKLDHFFVYEEPDCEWLYLIDLETGDTDPVDAQSVYSDDDEYYSISLLEKEKNIRLIKDLGPLKNHLKVSAFK